VTKIPINPVMVTAAKQLHQINILGIFFVKTKGHDSTMPKVIKAKLCHAHIYYT